MRRNKILVLSIVSVLLFQAAMAQQDPNHSFYRYNMGLYNPAFTGSEEGPELVLGLRSQWAGVEGAPESQSAIFGTPLGRRVGIGVSILNDQTFIENQTWLAVDFSYHIDLNEATKLYFGLKASANSYNANTQGLVTYGLGQDGALLDYEGRFTPNVGAGAYLKTEKYFLSLSAPRLLTPERLQERNGNAFLGTYRVHAYLSGGYTFVLGKNFDLRALSMLRYVDASPISYELTAIADFNQRFNFGAGYRLGEGLSGLFMFRLANKFNIGYAYETAIERDIDNFDRGTHEILMKLGF